MTTTNDMGMMKYKLRAECVVDIVKMTTAFAKASIVFDDVEIEGDGLLPDVTATFLSAAPLAQLRDVLAKIEDGHVMAETIATIDHYTGMRTSDEPEACSS